jgi:hypothetical protein
MDEEILYPVCPHRNVPAAFQRFLGPDSGGIERFFPDEGVDRVVDGTLLVVRRQRERATRVLGDGLVLGRALLAVAVTASVILVQERVALLLRWRTAGGLPV